MWGDSPVPPSLGNAPAFSPLSPFTWLLKGRAPDQRYLRQRGASGQQLRKDRSAKSGQGRNPDHDPRRAAAATAVANSVARCLRGRLLDTVPRLWAGGAGGLSGGVRGGEWGAASCPEVCRSQGLCEERRAAVRGLHPVLCLGTAVPPARGPGGAFAGTADGPGPLSPGASAHGGDSKGE